MAVHVLLLRRERLLLLRRCNTGFEDGKLSVVAGHVEPGEPVTQATIREASEEVDFFLTYRLGPDGEEPRNCEPEKCSELVRANLESLPADTIPYVRAGIERFRHDAWFQEFGWEPAESVRPHQRAS